MTHEAERIEIPGAACTLYRDGPVWQGETAATMGKFTCADAATGALLLNSVVARLEAEGRHGVLGPMDGDTWHSYRLVGESDGSPPFLLEPQSAPHDLEAFGQAGFAPVASYVSTRASIADTIRQGDHAVPDGLTVAPWDGQNADALIVKIFEMSAESFSRNMFFKPITQAQFLDIYRPLMAAIDPRLVFFAHAADGALAGYLFGVPDYLGGEKPSTVIIKTYASNRKGAGRALADRFHRTVHDLGFKTVIHALMHDDNASKQSSLMFKATVFRRYLLMGRAVAS
jgi:hypothetical protein